MEDGTFPSSRPKMSLKEKIDKFYNLYSGFLDGIEPCLLEEDNDVLIEMGTLLDEMKEEIYKL